MSDAKVLSAKEFKRQVELCLNGNLQAHERILAHQAAMLPSRATKALASMTQERDAQAERIQELENLQSDSHDLLVSMKQERDAALQQIMEIRAELGREEMFRRDTSLKLHAALQRAEEAESALKLDRSLLTESEDNLDAAEDLLRQIREVLPPDWALQIANRIEAADGWPYYEDLPALRAYAAVAEEKP